MFKAEYIIIISLIQSFLLLILSLWYRVDLVVVTNTILNSILFISIGLSILSIIMAKDLVRIIKFKVDYKVQEVKADESKKLIRILRSQKHDFLNHLQTLYGMIQLNKLNEAKDYISSLRGDIVSVKGSDDSSRDDLVDSLLLAKRANSLKLGISFDYSIDSSIYKVKLPLNKVFRLISNLVDNAIEATDKFVSEKKIEIRGEVTDGTYLLSVYNSGPTIEKNLIDSIVEPGFSTKGEERGYGLYIIKTIVEENGGRLEIISSEDYGTEFRCFLLE